MVEFYGLIDETFSDGVITKTIWQYIRNPNPTIPTFYCLPKIHKEGVLRGRPIVSVTNNITEGASRLIDRTPRPHVETLFSYVKDTMSFLQFMDGLLAPEGSFLVTIDIECL